MESDAFFREPSGTLCAAARERTRENSGAGICAAVLSCPFGAGTSDWDGFLRDFRLDCI